MEKNVNGIIIKTVPKEWDVYFDMALTMLEEIIRNNEAGKKTVMIVPVGPTEQYPILAKLVNRLNVSLKNVYFFNMDEYLVAPDKVIDSGDKMSFHGRMNSEFYERVDPKLVMDVSHRLFPEPKKEVRYDKLLEELGGADLCLGGLGINGHIAFNEAAEENDPVTVEEFAGLGTRVLKISRETRTINAYGYQRGDLRGMPEYCITIGMKQILSSRRIYLALNREWQHGIAKHVLFDKPQAQIPATLLQLHGNVEFCTSESIAKGLF
ncbi:MAG: glucosamine-6-phosphate isomerase [Candidatus Neoclostridium sp.]